MAGREQNKDPKQQRDAAISHVAAVHCEATTGILNPLEYFGERLGIDGLVFRPAECFGGDLEAFGHEPTPPGVPMVLVRASTTNPARTLDRWRTVAPDLADVVVQGRHRGYDSIMHADKVGAIAAEIARRMR